MRSMRNMDMVRMRAKREGVCPRCGQRIQRGKEIIWIPATREASHYRCAEADYSRAMAERQDEERWARP